MSIVELPKYPVITDPRSPMFNRSPEEQAEYLHFKKNKPERPELEDAFFPPYQYQPYPCAMYRDWSEQSKMLEMRRIAGRMQIDLRDPHSYNQCEYELPRYESKQVGVVDCEFKDGAWHVNQQLRDKNESDHRIALGQGWADTPDGVKAAKDTYIDKPLALATAHRHYEDRNLGEVAKREVEAQEDEADHHIPEIQETPVRRGRKAKENAHV